MQTEQILQLLSKLRPLQGYNWQEILLPLSWQRITSPYWYKLMKTTLLTKQTRILPFNRASAPVHDDLICQYLHRLSLPRLHCRLHHRPSAYGYYG